MKDVIQKLNDRGKSNLAWLLRNSVCTNDIPTCGVSENKTIYVNESFISSLSVRQVEAILTHEALHIALNHCLRMRQYSNGCMDRNQAYNIAADAHINEHLPDLRDVGGVFFDKLPDIGEDPSLLTTEELADKLLESGEKMEEGHDFHDFDDSPNTDTEAVQKMAKEVFDSLSDGTKQKLCDVFEANIMQADRLSERKPCEDAIQKLIGSAWMKPRVESYARPPRRELGDMLLRGKASAFTKPIVDIYIDVSGSMAECAQEWVAFGNRMCSLYGGQLRISCWSDDVPEPKIALTDNFKSGGTNWKALKKYLDMPRGKSHKAVVITDMEGGAPIDVEHADCVINENGYVIK